MLHQRCFNKLFYTNEQVSSNSTRSYRIERHPGHPSPSSRLPFVDFLNIEKLFLVMRSTRNNQTDAEH